MSMTLNYSTTSEKSSDETNLLALMLVDCAVLRTRAEIDEPPHVYPKRKPRSAETRAKIAAAVTGQKKSAETRAKIAASVSRARSKKSSIINPCCPPAPTTHRRKQSHV